MSTEAEHWRIFHGDGRAPHPADIPAPPAWRRPSLDGGRPRYVLGDADTDVVNAALHLRRPLLVTGVPGTGKSTLAHAIAEELMLGEVLTWPVNSHSTLQDALYRYDSIGRLHESSLRTAEVDIGDFIRLGPLGTALVSTKRPRVLLVDEMDKGDIDLPNDLLNVLEQGTFEIPELTRMPARTEPFRVLSMSGDSKVDVGHGMVLCEQFPVVVITSNGERDFPAAFRRRCIPLRLLSPDRDRLRTIISNHFTGVDLESVDVLLGEFLRRRDEGVQQLATDQLLNAVFLRLGGADLSSVDLLGAIFSNLDSSD
ncbi:AAA family ATPase [Dactylosporangium sp. CS-033363]|uniref:AAA family ATPase n=1 Tax=Dactylosporangium sp. CS-033363 TaxID=3239935 RepID=UPI003D9079EC